MPLWFGWCPQLSQQHDYFFEGEKERGRCNACVRLELYVHLRLQLLIPHARRACLMMMVMRSPQTEHSRGARTPQAKVPNMTHASHRVNFFRADRRGCPCWWLVIAHSAPAHSNWTGEARRGGGSTCKSAWQLPYEIDV